MAIDKEEQERLAAWKRKREERKRQQEQGRESEFLNSLDDAEHGDNDDSAEIMTTAKRRKQEQEALLRESIVELEENVDGSEKNSYRKTIAQRRKQAFQALHNNITMATRPVEVDNEDEDEEKKSQNEHDDFANKDLRRFAPATADVGGSVGVATADVDANMKQHNVDDHDEKDVYDFSDPAARLRRQQENEEARILKEASKVQANALQAATEVAKGVVYKTPMPSSWTVPSYIIKQGPEAWQKIRDVWHMQVQGNDIPPPLKRFIDMKLPYPVIELLKEKGIQRPTPIQMQGLPVALAGRDMVGIAFTGSGKTLTFAIPLVMAALEDELLLPLVAGEGPVGIILAPSRELARQTHELVHDLCQKISETSGYPKIRTQLMIGGESVKDQLRIVQQEGLHCLVATPGRLRDVLKRHAINLTGCRFICLDEADRLIDMGFDEEVGEIMNHFPHQRQTLLFSATFPQKFQDFCRQVLVQPIVVNVGRAGAANLDVIQEVEYVKEEAKIVHLLQCLQKTAPPVIIFCERKGAADDIHEYFLLKGVEAVSIHGGKDQEERNQAIALFKSGKKDVLIATDVAAKGLDFPDIQHVINFDMPNEIENYVHRIGRTGRCGKTGVATTFINKSCSETTLLDLKALLKEAKQRIPPVLEMLDDPREKLNGGSNVGCSFCGGLGHSIVDCPKIDKDARRVAGSKRDVLAGGGDW